MQTTARTAFSIVVSILLIGSAFAVGFLVGESQRLPVSTIEGVLNRENDAATTADFSPFWEAWRHIDEKHVAAEDVVAQERVWGAIQGLAGSLGDPYTVFLPPEENEVFTGTISGNFGGVGMEIGIRDNAITVIAPLPGTPAERAGIESGDIIAAVDGETTAHTTIDSAVRRIRGEIGTDVMLTLVREGREESFDVVLTRAQISVPTIATELRDDGIFVIELFNFSAISPQRFRDALRTFIGTKTDKLIIDLRGNPGGFLEAAIDITSWFVPTGKVIVREEFRDESLNRTHRSRGYRPFNDNLQLVVLVDGGSASASEIFAGALKEQGVATVIGSKTFGKGSVQEFVAITDEPATALRVTVAKWLTPDGHSISEGGLEPDIVVERTREDTEAGRDLQLERAVQFLSSGE